MKLNFNVSVTKTILLIARWEDLQFNGERFTGCIPIDQYNDGIQQCSDGSDENFQVKKVVNCGQCDVTINRLNNVSQCNLNPPTFLRHINLLQRFVSSLFYYRLQ